MNPLKYTLLILCILLVREPLWASTDKLQKHKILGIRTGIYNLSSLDNLYSPFNYSGKALVLGLHFGTERPDRNKETRLVFSNINRDALSMAGIPSTYDPNHYLLLKNSFIFEAMDYFRFLIYDPGQDLRFYFSALWFTTVNITTNVMGLPELVQSGIAPGVMIRKNAGRHTFRTEIHTPLLAWTVRNNYGMSSPQTFEEFSKFAFIFQNSMLQSCFSAPGIYADISYGFRLNKAFRIDANYHFRYFQNSKPITLRSTSGMYSLSIIYTR
ncbi:MAG: hypothetical protein U5N56_13145 [Candidatus Marinimicrobia bacterium]|nr:hypothetical protein [Candidatus Neomarinimicrobiota bacterium]